MSHNLEYLITRPGVLKLGTIVFGIISFTVAAVSHRNSPYSEYYSNQTASGQNAKNLPGTELELYNIGMNGLFLGISIAYLVLHSLFYELCENQANRIVDTVVHMMGALFLFGGGCVMLYSTSEIQDYGCKSYEDFIQNLTATPKTSLSPFIQSIFIHSDVRSLPCQNFGEKIVGGIFALINAVLYCATGVTVFTTKDYF